MRLARASRRARLAAEGLGGDVALAGSFVAEYGEDDGERDEEDEQGRGNADGKAMADGVSLEAVPPGFDGGLDEILVFEVVAEVRGPWRRRT